MAMRARGVRLPNKPRFYKNESDTGPMLVHDCTIYRARADQGKNNDHYTKPQLEKIFQEAAVTRKHGIPFLDTHLYGVEPIGRLHKWWFTNDGWLHGSGEIFGQDVLGRERYQHIKQQWNEGRFTDVSLSVAQGKLPDGRLDPDNLTLNEISFCHRGRHKNCNIKILEASDQSQSNKTYHHEGKIMSLTIQHDNGAIGGLDTSKLEATLEDVIATARERGIEFTQAEIDEFAKAGPQGVLPATQFIVGKMAERMAGLSRDNEGMKGIVTEVNQNYIKQRETDIEMAKEYYQSKVASGKLTEERAKQLSDMAEALGKDRNQANAFDTMISGIVESKALAQQLAEVNKNLEKSKNAQTRMQREVNREQRRDASPKRTPVQQQTSPAQQATKPAAAAAKPAAPNPRAVAPADANEAPTGEPANPGELAQSLTPAVHSNQGYVLVNADAYTDDQPWINEAAPLAIQAAYARSLPSQNLSRLYDIMAQPNYFADSLSTRIAPIGQQGFQRQNNYVQYASF